jgi:hypothetical protein
MLHIATFLLLLLVETWLHPGHVHCTAKCIPTDAHPQRGVQRYKHELTHMMQRILMAVIIRIAIHR